MDIVLSTLNARYSHSSFGLRYLYANLSEELRPRAEIVEFTIQQDPRKIAEELLARNPKIVGFGVYIWNTRETEAVLSILRKLAPEVILVLGGPEVSYETEGQSIVRLANLVICGEGDFQFNQVCHQILIEGNFPSEKIKKAPLPEITKIKSPYPFYSDHDVAHRAIYVEASRGCPYKCEYCLSSLDVSVRNFPLEEFLADIQTLIERGARSFKFIDRTFNLKPAISVKILQFFLERAHLGLFLHFEMVPDRLPEELRQMLVKFPEGSLQFEIGIQTFHEKTAALVSRKNDLMKVKENFQFLTEKTNVHIHADLIAGLPAETLETFAIGFDRLLEMAPHEIQLGLLKRLKGTPISRHDLEWKMIYEDRPPFQILSTSTMPFHVIQKMETFADFWDLIGNSGNFGRTLEWMRARARRRSDQSFFWFFYDVVTRLSKRHLQTHGIALPRLTESLWGVLGEICSEGEKVENEAEVFELQNRIIDDYCVRGKRSALPFMGERGRAIVQSHQQGLARATPARQARHLAGKV